MERRERFQGALLGLAIGAHPQPSAPSAALAARAA